MRRTPGIAALVERAPGAARGSAVPETVTMPRIGRVVNERLLAT